MTIAKSAPLAGLTDRELRERCTSAARGPRTAADADELRAFVRELLRRADETARRKRRKRGAA